MIRKIQSIHPEEDYILSIMFEDGRKVSYDLKEDFGLPGYDALEKVPGLYQQVRLDESRTCVYWNEDIDLPSDILYEYGQSRSS